MCLYQFFESGTPSVVEEGMASEEVVALSLAVDPAFDLERAVCSHGLFMMAPNQWDPNTKTLQRPLRLSPRSSSSLTVRISQTPSPPSPLLLISVLGTARLSPCQQECLLAQVRRMLRLSEEEQRAIREFHKVHPQARENGFGRIFRSPTLFEDMVKCVLLCNCQWPRTLSMARALCDLQLEIRNCTNVEDLCPKTPQKRDLKRKRVKKKNIFLQSASNCTGNEIEASTSERLSSNHVSTEKYSVEDETKSAAIPFTRASEVLSNTMGPTDTHTEQEPYHLHYLSEKSPCVLGNFPSPEELAVLNENLLAHHCGLGYRAKRILSLAKSIVEGKLQLKELEKLCVLSTTPSYDTLNKQLQAIDGFGPYTCANVLMCMGFYHKIPADTETMRHLKQFHARSCTTKTVHVNIEDIYKSYAPFQFLAYWFELWGFYEITFGKLSELHVSDYSRITASNMKNTATSKYGTQS